MAFWVAIRCLNLNFFAIYSLTGFADIALILDGTAVEFLVACTTVELIVTITAADDVISSTAIYLKYSSKPGLSDDPASLFHSGAIGISRL